MDYPNKSGNDNIKKIFVLFVFFVVKLKIKKVSTILGQERR